MIKTIIITIMIISSLSATTFKEAKEIEKEFGVLKALSTYKSLSKSNNKEALFRLAMIYSKNKPIKRDLSKTKQLLERASKLGFNKATYFLGKLYLSKKSPFYDLTNAFNTFLEASNKNYAPAQNMIGQFLLTGVLIPKDYKEAVKYFEKSSSQGYTEADCNLAFMYASGKGVFPNFGRAHIFAKKGVVNSNKKCLKVWKDYDLSKYKKDKGWKFNFYTKP